MALRNAFEDLATDATLRERLPVLLPTGEAPVADDYEGGEVLADQIGPLGGGVLDFVFAAPVALVLVEMDGVGIARADPFGGVPANDRGIRCRDEVPTYLPIRTSRLRIWTPEGASVAVAGFRRV